MIIWDSPKYRTNIFINTNLRKNILNCNYLLRLHHQFMPLSTSVEAPNVEKLFHLVENVFHYHIPIRIRDQA